jgi:hypothetical protein
VVRDYPYTTLTLLPLFVLCFDQTARSTKESALKSRSKPENAAFIIVSAPVFKNSLFRVSTHTQTLSVREFSAVLNHSSADLSPLFGLLVSRRHPSAPPRIQVVASYKKGLFFYWKTC